MFVREVKVKEINLAEGGGKSCDSLSCQWKSVLGLAPEKALAPAQRSFTLLVDSSTVAEEWSCQPQSSSQSFRRPFRYQGIQWPGPSIRTKTLNLNSYFMGSQSREQRKDSMCSQ